MTQIGPASRPTDRTGPRWEGSPEAGSIPDGGVRRRDFPRAGGSLNNTRANRARADHARKGPAVARFGVRILHSALRLATGFARCLRAPRRNQ